MGLEQGISQMTLTTIRPIPKPSIGDHESFVEGTGESFMNGGKTLSMIGVVKNNNRYNYNNVSDAQKKIEKMESFDLLTIECMNESTRSQIEDIIPQDINMLQQESDSNLCQAMDDVSTPDSHPVINQRGLVTTNRKLDFDDN